LKVAAAVAEVDMTPTEHLTAPTVHIEHTAAEKVALAHLPLLLEL
jgi:hypothetical protein